MAKEEISAQTEPVFPRRQTGNGGDATPSIDPRILAIARAIGRQIARNQLKTQAANDDDPVNK